MGTDEDCRSRQEIMPALMKHPTTGRAIADDRLSSGMRLKATENWDVMKGKAMGTCKACGLVLGVRLEARI
jgi:hypothetical protein